MIRARQVLLVAALLLLAAVLQGRLAYALRVRGAQPDFPLIVLACGATLVGSTRGTLLGLWCGWLTAAQNPEAFGSDLASRVLAGAFAGALQRSVIRDSLVVPPLVVLSTTLVAEGVYTLMAPAFAWHHPRVWVRITGGELLYNTAFSLPVYFLLRRLRIGQVSSDSFASLP